MTTVVIVPLGIIVAGALGTLLRVVVTNLDAAFNRQLVGTLLVNVVGSFLLALLSASNTDLAIVAAIGGLGALTTFSTFIAQVEGISRKTNTEIAGAYVLASIILGVAGALLGLAMG